MNSPHSTTDQTAEPAGEKHLVVRIANERYALPIRRVRGIVANVDITAVPGAPSHVRGVMRPEGGPPVTVIDLRRLFGAPSSRGDTDACIVITEIATNDRRRTKLGLMVDAVAETAVFAAKPQHAGNTQTNGGTMPSFIRDVARADDGKTIVLLDVDQLVADSQPRLNDQPKAA